MARKRARHAQCHEAHGRTCPAVQEDLKRAARWGSWPINYPICIGVVAGILLQESHVTRRVHKKFYEAVHSMGTALKCPEVWRPCLCMYIPLNLSLDIQGGMFYRHTDPDAGLAFFKGFIGLIYSIGSVGSLLGVLLYQSALKEYPPQHGSMESGAVKSSRNARSIWC
ncbi:hypothetical protein ACP70R_002701 [Stipagrostis hirtigluma subsp. patula]